MRFYKLCDIKFIHKFFSDQYYNGLKIYPTTASVKTMKSYGLLQKKIGNEFLLIYKDEGPGKSLLNQLTKPLVLSFYIICEDVFLLNYSDLSLDNINQGFRLVNKYAEEDTVRPLHKNEVLSEEEKVILVNSYNALEQYCKGEEDTITVYDTAEEKELFNGPLKDLKNGFPFSELVEIGSFTIKTGEDPKPINCYAVGLFPGKIFGVLDLSINAEMLNPGSISYEVTIGSKEVVWRYHIINREQVSYKDFKIYAGKNILPVKKESLMVLGTGENAYLLETSEPITMAERYENLYELEFIKEDPKTGQILSKKRLGLPVPEISKIKISKSGEGYQAYSDMYIYL